MFYPVQDQSTKIVFRRTVPLATVSEVVYLTFDAVTIAAQRSTHYTSRVVMVKTRITEFQPCAANRTYVALLLKNCGLDNRYFTVLQASQRSDTFCVE